jgi:ribonuclease D
VRSAIAAADRGDAPLPSERPRPSPDERAVRDATRVREERLRRWRKDEAARRKVPNVVVLPNPGMLAMASCPPTSVDAVAALPDVGEKRARLYGARWLELLAEPVTPHR